MIASICKTLYKHGLIFYKNKKYLRAELVFAILHFVDKNNFDPSHYLGLINFKKKHYKSSIAVFSKIIAANPSYPFAYYNLALSYQMLNQSETAKTYYSKAIEANESDFESYYNLGVIYYNEEDYNNALKNFIKANEITPDKVLTLYYIANCKDHLCQYNTDIDGEVILHEYLKLEKKEHLIKNYGSTIATVYAKVGDIKNCKRYCKMALDKDICDWQCYKLLGLIYLIEGKCDKSQKCLALGLKLRPDDKEFKELVSYI